MQTEIQFLVDQAKDEILMDKKVKFKKKVKECLKEIAVAERDLGYERKKYADLLKEGIK